MRISFHGAAREVTGSCVRLQTKDADGIPRELLFDCGLFQGERMCGVKNHEEFGFDPKNISAVFVTHAHADHCGRLPKLIKLGYEGPIMMTEPTLALMKIVLKDAHHIMEENAKKCGDAELYSEEDLNELIERASGIGYHQTVQVAPGITVMFHDAGHILGSSYISVETEGKRIIISGDIGNDDVPILPDTEPISSADIVITESTYGARLHEPITERKAKLQAAIEKTVKDKSVLMIPAFSIERTQELLYEINNILLKDFKTNMPIYLDSPMAIRATAAYRHYKNYLKFDTPILEDPERDFFTFPNLRETLDRQESMTINNAKPPFIVIAGSGMMSGGRIMHHLKRYLSDEKNQLLIIGYQAKGTLGRQIYEGNKHVTIYQKRIPVNAQITAIGSFSAHGDQEKITKWLQPEDGKIPEKIFLVHGDPEDKEVFATHLRHNLKTEVIIPEYHGEYEI